MNKYVIGQRVYSPGYQSYIEIIDVLTIPDKDDVYLVRVESGYFAGLEVVGDFDSLGGETIYE